MAQAGAHLVDNVLPDAPLRQWVLTVPFPLRMLLAKDAALLSSVIRIFGSEGAPGGRLPGATRPCYAQGERSLSSAPA
jgi:hypothetical protein